MFRSILVAHTSQLRCTYHATAAKGEYADMTALPTTLTDAVLGSGKKSVHFRAIPLRRLLPALFIDRGAAQSGDPARSGSRRFGMTEDGIMHGDAISLAPYADHDEVRDAPGLQN